MAPFCHELFYVWKSIVFILMVRLCHEICKRPRCYLHLGKRNKFYTLSSCDLISNNCKQFLIYPGTTHLLRCQRVLRALTSLRTKVPCVLTCSRANVLVLIPLFWVSLPLLLKLYTLLARFRSLITVFPR